MKGQLVRTWVAQLALWAIIALLPILLWAGPAEDQNKTGSADSTKSEVKGSPRSTSGAPPRLPNNPAVSNDYIIGPEDLLAINVWHEPEISRSVPVRPDGKISLPLIGDLEASGLTPLKLQARIAAKLRAFVSNPEVTVIVQEARSQKVDIVGQVQRPGSYRLIRPMRVLDVIAEAGGFLKSAKVKKIYILRSSPDGSQERIPFNYKEFINGTDTRQNLELEPGDTVVVP